MSTPEYLKQVKTNFSATKQYCAKAKNSSAKSPADVSACKQSVHIGIFFDGTDNNMDRDSAGSKKAYTNVVSLFRAYKEDSKKGHFRFYVPGVGTEFEAVGEKTESLAGKSRGWGGGKRIYYAIFQVLNAVNRMVNKTNLVNNKEIASAVNTGAIRDGALTEVFIESPVDVVIQKNPAIFFSPYINKLEKNIKNGKPEIDEIFISVFGFSRGSAQARAFCNVFLKVLGKTEKLCNIKTTINFLGIFDTVASVGTPRSTPGIGGSFAFGLVSWADGTMKIPDNVKRCVHFVAGHEIRLSFPLSSIMYKGKYPNNSKEVVYPGVHSDIGGGYAPGDQGKAIDIASKNHQEEEDNINKKYDELYKARKKAFDDYKYPDSRYDPNSIKNGEIAHQLLQKKMLKTFDERKAALKKHSKKNNYDRNNLGRMELLSQVPLRHMFEEACPYVLPFVSYEKMKKNYELDQDFRVSSSVETLLTRYVSLFEKNTSNFKQEKSNMDKLENLFFRSQELLLSWRWSIQVPNILDHLPKIEKANVPKWFEHAKEVIIKLKSYARANEQEKQDMIEANKDYMLDMWEIINDKKYGCRNKSTWLRFTQIIDYIANNKRYVTSVDPNLNRLFDDCIHDSHAGFYISGPRSAFEKKRDHKTAIEEVKKGNANNFQRQLAKIKDPTKNFPLMTDDIVSELRFGGVSGKFQQWISSSSCRPDTRREAGGHVKSRDLYDSNKG